MISLEYVAGNNIVSLIPCLTSYLIEHIESDRSGSKSCGIEPGWLEAEICGTTIEFGSTGSLVIMEKWLMSV